jgi:sugar phosphate permease
MSERAGTSTQPPRLAPSGMFYGWVVVAVTTVALIVTAGTRAAPGALLVDMERNTSWSTSQLSLAAGLGLVTYGFSGPVAGVLMRRFGMRAVTTASLLGSALAYWLSSRVESIWALCLWFGLVSGMAAGLIASVLSATVANRWFVERRGLVTGLFGASTSAGLLLFFPIFAAIGSSSGWRSAMTIGATVAGLAAIPVWWFMRDSPAQMGLAPFGGSPEPPPVADAGIMRRAIRRPEFWLLAGTFMVCGGTSNGLIGQHFIAHATDHGFGEVTAANWLAVMGVFNFVGTLVSGWLTDRIDPRRLLLAYYSFRGLSLFFLPVIHDNVSIAVFAVLFGLDYIATVPPTIMLCADLFGRRNAGVVYGWVFAAHQLGAAGAAWGAGLVRDAVGSYGWAFSSAGAVAIVAGLAATMIRRPAPMLGGAT